MQGKTELSQTPTLERFDAVLTATTPIVHGGEEKASNDSLFRRQRFLGPENEVVLIPMISGNAVRGRLRRIAMERWCRLADLPEKFLSPEIYYRLFSGGVIGKNERAGKLTVGDRERIRRLIPPLSLFGTAWGADMIQGKMMVGHAIPVVKETQPMTGIPSGLSVHEITDDYALTRKDDRHSRWMKRTTDDEKETDWFAAVDELGPSKRKDRTVPADVQMIYRVEAIVPGIRFSTRFVLEAANPIERACFADLIREWRLRPSLGGKASSGFGMFSLELTPELEESAGTNYEDSLSKMREEIREFVETQGHGTRRQTGAERAGQDGKIPKAGKGASGKGRIRSGR